MVKKMVWFGIDLNTVHLLLKRANMAFIYTLTAVTENWQSFAKLTWQYWMIWLCSMTIVPPVTDTDTYFITQLPEYRNLVSFNTVFLLNFTKPFQTTQPFVHVARSLLNILLTFLYSTLGDLNVKPYHLRAYCSFRLKPRLAQ